MIPSSRHSIGIAFHGFKGEIKDDSLGACGGLGLARRLLDALERPRISAISLRAAWPIERIVSPLTKRHNDNPYAHFWFEKEFDAPKA